MQSAIFARRIRGKVWLGTVEPKKHEESGSHFWIRMTFGFPRSSSGRLRRSGSTRARVGLASPTRGSLMTSARTLHLFEGADGAMWGWWVWIKGQPESLAKMRDPFCICTLLVHARVAKGVGWFDPNIKYAEDHDFLLRLSLATPVCYVNSLLCSIDQSRSPEGSRCRPWDDIDVRLQGWQSILEKWLKLDGQLTPDIRKTVVHNLQCVHSAWANWHLEHGKYDAAVSSLRRALGYEISAKLLTKWMMMQFAPSMTRRIAPRMRIKVNP